MKNLCITGGHLAQTQRNPFKRKYNVSYKSCVDIDVVFILRFDFNGTFYGEVINAVISSNDFVDKNLLHFCCRLQDGIQRMRCLCKGTFCQMYGRKHLS